MVERAIPLPDAQYLALIERTEELARLQAQASQRKSMLVFGPEGVGKTRLLQAFAKTQPYSLYVPAETSMIQMRSDVWQVVRGYTVLLRAFFIFLQN